MKHFLVNFVYFTRHIITNPRFIQQEWNIVTGGNDKWQFFGGGRFTPEFSITVSIIGQNRMTGLSVFQSTVNEQFLESGRSDFLQKKEEQEQKYRN